MMRPPKIHVISVNEYRSSYWPRVREAVAAALLNPWNVSFSSEEFLRTVYNLCTQRHSAMLHEDLTQLISAYIQEEAGRLAVVPDAEFFARVHQHMKSYKRAAEILCTGFSYLERTYLIERVGSKLGQILQTLQQRLIFQSSLRMRFASLLPLLSTHGADIVELSTFIKDIHAIDPEISAYNPALFSLYVPCFTPAHSIEHDARETQIALAQIRSQAPPPSSNLSSVNLKRSFNDAVMT